MLRVVHGGVTAGRVDSHNSSLALMIAPRLWYRKPRPASSGGTAALAAPATPSCSGGWGRGVAFDRLLSTRRACFNAAQALGQRHGEQPTTGIGGNHGSRH